MAPDLTDEKLLIAGAPRFKGRNAANLAERIDAWQTLLSGDVPAALGQVSGAYAVAWRKRTGHVVMAVDRFAIRSLCWCLRDGRLEFAEDAHELASGGEELDLQALFDYLYFHMIPSPRTVFRDVYRLPPGHFLTYDGSQVKVEPYWTPTFDESARSPNFATAAGEFRELLAQSVRSQLDGHRAACFLSGGTDSSTVAGMLREVSGTAPATYSIGFDAEGYDEMSYARLASRHFGTEHHEYYVTPDDLVAHMPFVAAHYDQPFGNSSALPAFLCCRMARADGVTRLLAGDGGDELFGGNARYGKQRVFNIYGAVPQGIRSSLLEPVADSTFAKTVPGLRKFSSYVEQARQPMPMRLEGYNQLLRLGVANVLTPEFIAGIDVGSPMAQQAKVWLQARTSDLVNRQLAFDWRYTLAENDLPKVCRTAQLAGVEVGFPLLDSDIVDFSLRLPVNYKLRGLRLRWFFKEALRGFLPNEILTKKKHGFGLPFGVWTTRHEGLRRLSTDTLAALAERGLVRRDFIERLLRELLPGHPSYYGEMVWILMMLEFWLQAHAPAFRLR